MCFSATASFGAGAVLCAVGVLSLRKVQASSQLVFASIPVLFSVQQFAEGLLWLSLTNKDYGTWTTSVTILFLFFAQVVWPAWVPLSLYLLEKDARRKKILLFLAGMGTLLGLYLAYCLAVYDVSAEILSDHIHYTLDFPLPLMWISGVVYFTSTVVSPFISGNSKMRLLAIMILSSYLFTKIFYAGYFVSVWCFFAAIISMFVLSIVSGMNRSATGGEGGLPLTNAL